MTRAAYCWVGDCDATLEWVDHAWHCPNGHHLRRYEDLSPWVRDHVEFLQADPAMHRRYFGDRP